MQVNGSNSAPWLAGYQNNSNQKSSTQAGQSKASVDSFVLYVAPRPGQPAAKPTQGASPDAQSEILQKMLQTFEKLVSSFIDLVKGFMEKNMPPNQGPGGDTDGCECGEETPPETAPPPGDTVTTMALGEEGGEFPGGPDCFLCGEYDGGGGGGEGGGEGGGPGGGDGCGGGDGPGGGDGCGGDGPGGGDGCGAD